jgi:hypothetical protein
MEVGQRRAAPLNGHARATARILAALRAYGSMPCVLALRVLDEAELRDCTEAQLGISGVCAARASAPVWRRFLIAHFERQAIELAFDADVLRATVPRRRRVVAARAGVPKSPSPSAAAESRQPSADVQR